MKIIVFLSVLFFYASIANATLVSYWNFNNPNQRTQDLSGNNNNATLADGTFIQDKYGLNDSMHFDGTDDYFYIPSADRGDLNFSSDFTVSMWIKMESHSAPTVQLVRNWNFGYTIWIDQTQPEQRIAMAAGTSGYSVAYSSSVNLLDDNWHQVLFSYYNNGSNWITELFFDGASVGSVITTGPAIYGNHMLSIGYNYYGDVYYKGFMDEIKFYDEQLSAQTIADQYNYDVANLINSSAVPEPLSILLFSMASSFLLLRKKRI